MNYECVGITGYEKNTPVLCVAGSLSPFWRLRQERAGAGQPIRRGADAEPASDAARL